MSYEKIQEKEAYSNFTINPHDIDRSFDPLKGSDSAGKWILGLINITNEEYVLASVTNADGNYGKWFEIPRVGRNCQTNYDDCTQNGQWTAILALGSGSAPFSIRIATRPDRFGVATGTEFLQVTPRNSPEGGFIGISE